jgi:DNA polymerase III alpha subunit (gram-positive type)
MQSPYKKVIVYDLETGGLKKDVNAITEIAMVVIDLETLKVEETFSTIIKPMFDLEKLESESVKEAKAIFKAVAIKDIETKVPYIMYKGQRLTVKDLDPIIQDIDELEMLIERKGTQYNYDQIVALENSEKYGDITKLYFDKTYNPEAMKVTHMTRDMLVNEGIDIAEAVEKVADIFKRYTIGNAKPILAGHNIKKFDNPFLEKFLLRGNYDLSKMISETQMIDTLEWARLRWFDAPSFSLGVCVNAVGLTLKEAHRALPDTEANAQLLIKMLKGLRGEGQSEKKYERRKFKFNF